MKFAKLAAVSVFIMVSVICGCKTEPCKDVGPVTPVNPQYEQSKGGDPQLPYQKPWWKY